MYTDILLGLQWGDEGKGKIVDFLAPQYDIVARFQGGPNAGHTLVIDGEKTVLHIIPSGIFRPQTLNVIGNGVVIDPIVMKKEIEGLKAAGVDVQKNLFVSKKAHLILPSHKILDAASEASKGDSKIGSTLRGIGPAYMDKTGRNGLRVGDATLANFRDHYNGLKEKHKNLLKIYDFEYNIEEHEAAWFDGIETLLSLNLIDCEYFINNSLAQGKKVLAEGAQGSMLDIDFGTYPFVTSSNTISAAVCSGLGIAPKHIKDVYGISKAYATRVGAGPFPTELLDDTGEFLRKEGAEFGATTGRPRRCGWLDLPALKYTAMLSGLDQLIITKIDVLNLFEELKACTKYKVNGQLTDQLPYDIENFEIEPVYESFEGWNRSLDDFHSFEDLPQVAKTYLHFIEEYIGAKITIVSNGPGREQLIHKNLTMNPA